MKTVKFNVVVPAYNVENLLPQTLDSLLAQSYDSYRITVIDDASEDGTLSIASDYMNKYPNRVSVIRSPSNRGPTNSVRLGCETTRDDEIVVQVDGDGDFIHKDTLLMYSWYYARPDVWMVGGMLERWSEGRLLSYYHQPIIDTATRKDGICHFHPRSWRKWLFFKVPDWHLRNPDTNEYWRHGSDASFVWPMWEMSGRDRVVFLPMFLYWHNWDNPLNTWKTEHVRRERDNYAERISSGRPFQRLVTVESPVRRKPIKKYFVLKDTKDTHITMRVNPKSGGVDDYKIAINEGYL